MSDRDAGGLRRMLAACFAAAIAGLGSAPARAGCSVGGLSGIVNGATIVSAASIPAAGVVPAFCAVAGRLNTTGEGAGPGAAGFELRLPAAWNGKMLMLGVGGLAGSTWAGLSANPLDVQQALPKGYAVAVTDQGHVGGGTDASFALLNAPDGEPDQPSRIDYAYRATHQVAVAAKRLATAFYGKPVQRAYFDGCSNGGRQAMVEATRYPEDFDGIVAGAPFLDLRAIIGAAAIFKALLASPDSFLPAAALPAIDAKVMAACDAADGVVDGLIQNPAMCNIKPKDLGVTAGQAGFLSTYVSTLRDERGRLLYSGHGITALSGGGMDRWFLAAAPTAPGDAEPWGEHGFGATPLAFQFADHILKDYFALDPAYDFRSFPVTKDGMLTNAALAAFDAQTHDANAASVAGYARYIAQGRKLIWYHGLSDPALPAFRDFVLYEEMARAHGGFAKLQDSVRFFAVPDMQHCVGGSGPNLFDALGPLEAWVEQGKAPQALVAAHFPNNKPAPGVAPDRTMPLCPFPTQASLTGDDAKRATSWTCAPNEKMLQVGGDGTMAGLTPAK